MTIFLSARADKSICGTDKSLSRRQILGPLQTHSLETSLYFLPNSCQVVYVEHQSLTHLSPLASPHRPSLPPPPPPLPPPPPPPRPPPPPPPPPPLCSSCLAPLAHRCRRRRHFCCSLLIVVCPQLCHCRRLCRLYRRRRLFFQHRHCRPLSDGHRHDCLRRNSCPLLDILRMPIFGI
jgi:hypothetical protein